MASSAKKSSKECENGDDGPSASLAPSALPAAYAAYASVWRSVAASHLGRPRRSHGGSPMIHRECGVLKTTYEADMALYPLPIARYAVAGLAVLFFLVIPLSLHEYYLSVANLVWIAVIGALGLNILVGYTGQVSIGHGAFMSVGASTPHGPSTCSRAGSWPRRWAPWSASPRCASRACTWPSRRSPASSSSSGPSIT